MWIWRQKTGELLNGGLVIGKGYAGFGDGKNNPSLERVRNLGPLPSGWYSIGPPNDTLAHGPFVLRLTPAPENEMYGRSGFLIHGDSRLKPGTASHGCIILSKALRKQIWESGDHQLTVVSGIISPPFPPGVS